MKIILCFVLMLPFLCFAQPKSNYNKALSYYALSDYNNCIAECAAQLNTYAYQEETYLLRAKCYVESKLFRSAINDLSICIARDKKNAQAFALRGFCYFQLDDYHLARRDYIEASYYDSTNAVNHYNLANIDQHMNKLGEAIKGYSRAIELKPEYGEAYGNRAFIYLRKNDYQLAILDLDSALKYGYPQAEAFLYRGMALSSLKRYKDAIDMFNRCIVRNPKSAPAYFNRGQVYYQLRNYKIAKANYDTAIMLNPKFELAYFNRALAYMEINNKNRVEACEDLNAAFKLGYLEGYEYIMKYCK